MLLYKAYNNRLTCLHPTTAFLELKNIYFQLKMYPDVIFSLHLATKSARTHATKSASLMHGLRHHGLMQHSQHCFPRERSHSLCWCLRLLEVDLHISLNQSCGAAAPGDRLSSPRTWNHNVHTSALIPSSLTAHGQSDTLHYTRSNCHIMKMLTYSISDKCEFIMLSVIQ